jgi:L-alanine-DL-glutamate epimerase-like enolase superfamily enzyme
MLEVEDGCLVLGSSPGLGFDVDSAKLEKYKVSQ